MFKLNSMSLAFTRWLGCLGSGRIELWSFTPLNSPTAMVEGSST